jgi:hypothetical protein
MKSRQQLTAKKMSSQEKIRLHYQWLEVLIHLFSDFGTTVISPEKRNTVMHILHSILSEEC